MSEELTHQPERKVLDLDSVIRTETVLSRLPFHNLSKKETVEILISREKTQSGEGANLPVKPAGGKQLDKYELYWSVHPNPKYGEPRQLAYDIDTLIINKRLDEQKRPIPRRLKIGTLRSIGRELGRGADSSVLEIKRALLQNSSAYVTLKVGYTDLDGNRRTAADHNTRYGVSFRGSNGPDGSKNEAVFITWNDPFLEILNSTKTRPLDYNYLRALPPTARRWYELMSFLFYATGKNHQPYAEMRYSEYCRLAPQKRLFDRHKAQTQLGKIHRYHLASGYLAKATYAATTDAEGNRDWILRYYPGPGATEEYNAFNGTTFKSSYQRGQLRALPDPQNDVKQHVEPRFERKTTPPASSPAIAEPAGALDQVMQHWRKLKGYPLDGPMPASDRATCASLLSQSNSDVAVAQRAIELALEENPDARNIAFALQNSYPQRALATAAADHDRAAKAEQVKLDQEALAQEKQAVIEKAKADFRSLPAEERELLVAEAHRKIRPFMEQMPDQWTPERIERSAMQTFINTALDQRARARFRTLQEGTVASTEAPK